VFSVLDMESRLIMESFSIVKRGYSPQEVDEYIEELEQVIKSYKDKDNAIKNAIISAQVAADNILKNSHLEIAEYKTRALSQLRHIYDSLELQRTRVQAFQDEYNELLRKYLRPLDDTDLAIVLDRIEELERFLRDVSNAVEADEEEYSIS